MWEFKLAALTFTLLTLGLVSIKFVSANRTTVLDKDEDKLQNALEVVVNGTVPSGSIRDKIYMFFYDLAVAQRIDKNDKLNDITKGNKRRFLLDLIPVVRDPSMTETGLIRYRRYCEEEEKKYASQKSAKEKEKKGVIENHEREMRSLKESICRDRCEFKCLQFKCPTHYCPAIPKDTKVCAEHAHITCPQGCEKVLLDISGNKTITTTNKPRPKRALKWKASPREPFVEDSLFWRAHKSEIRFKSVISELDEGSRKAYLNKLNNLANIRKIKQETMKEMFDILIYLTNDHEGHHQKSNPIFKMFEKVKDSKRGEVVKKGIKIILGYIMPSSLMSSKIIQEFSAKVKRRFKRGGNKETQPMKRIQVLLDNSNDPYGCFVCSHTCNKLFSRGCGFTCNNNKGCKGYQCVCHIFKSDFNRNVR